MNKSLKANAILIILVLAVLVSLFLVYSWSSLKTGLAPSIRPATPSGQRGTPTEENFDEEIKSIDVVGDDSDLKNLNDELQGL